MDFLRCIALTASVICLQVCVGAGHARAVTIDMVTVGDPGNAADTTGYGAVNSTYKIGKYDVTISQYAAFLNAVAASDPYGLYDTNMATNLNIAGISRGGSSGSYSYSVIGGGNRPITYVNWFDAARFANWMNNGQGSGSTETGAYTLGGATSGNAVPRNPGASYYIPTEDEWYKAAYYSPTKGGPGSPGYYLFATQSDTAPGNVVGAGANQANWNNSVFSVTQLAIGPLPSLNYLTDVGAFTNTFSYYGTFDQSGNVYNWNDLDGTAAGANRGARGGGWRQSVGLLEISSAGRSTPPTNFQNFDVGFRLASPVSVAIPEIDPAGRGGALALVAGALALLERRRRGPAVGRA